jgi:ankyrin repeat protein
VGKQETLCAICEVDQQDRTALNWAVTRAEEENNRILLANSTNPNSIDPTGRTTLHLAAAISTTECIRLLLKAGADPN